mgnify:CR=1 FL=1
MVKDPTDGTKLVLAIDRKPIAEWFKEQSDKLFTSIRKTVTSPRKIEVLEYNFEPKVI